MKPLRDRLRAYPAALIAALSRLSHGRVYLAGGTVRDWLMDRMPADLDLVVDSQAQTCCRTLQAELGSGVLVPLGEPENDTARFVWHGLTVDISGFRGGADSIEEDLRLRDFTINAMAVALRDLMDGTAVPELIDPVGGSYDLEQGVVRACDHAFADDPLRILRGFRFCATLGFRFHPSIPEAMEACSSRIGRVAGERINHELDLIMGSDQAGRTFQAMAAIGVLWHVLPELQQGAGLVQPGFHHLDVLAHSLETLERMEEVLCRPERFYPGGRAIFTECIERKGVKGHLKWAALLHDLGKPAAMEVHPEEDGRITFYNHDRIGREIFFQIAKRLRWSNAAKAAVGRLIEFHMYPFHLCNASRSSGLGKKACLRFWKKAGPDLPALFLLAMADSLACRGEKKPEGMEEELASLFYRLQETIDHCVQPVLSGPRLVTGDDLIGRFHLTPGPVFSLLLSKLETARVEGEIHNRQEALDWIAKYLQNRGA